MRLRLSLIAAAVATLGLVPATSHAETWPSKPIKMVVPFAAGGGTDFISRLVAQKLSERLGQQVFVENRGGAHGGTGVPAGGWPGPGR